MLWHQLPPWFRWSTIASFLGAVIMLASAMNAGRVLDPYLPALRGWVLTQIDGTATAQITGVRIKLLEKQIKDSAKYQLDLSIQKLDLSDKLAGLSFTDPNREIINRLIATLDASVEQSKKDELAAQCELSGLYGASFACRP